MARKKLRLSRFYAEVLGATFTNSRWSWGAIDFATGRLFLRVWKDQLEPIEGREHVMVLRAVPTTASPGYRERERHLALLEEGVPGYGVVCVARDTDVDAGRTIRSYNDRELLVLGKLVVRPEGRYAEVVRRVSLEELERAEGGAADLEEDIRAIRRNRSLQVTEREALVSARLGQGVFRTQVLARWGGRCAVTGSATQVVIRASHIKPWRDSDNEERQDPENGLPLVADLDALFDQRWVTFGLDGELLVSPRIPKKERTLLRLEGLRLRKRPGPLTLQYLEEHRLAAFRTRW
ncbi:MAG TPA: HNH endonuclease signature motif containing protein [Longimicrobium sp.]